MSSCRQRPQGWQGLVGMVAQMIATLRTFFRPKATAQAMAFCSAQQLHMPTQEKQFVFYNSVLSFLVNKLNDT